MVLLEIEQQPAAVDRDGEMSRQEGRCAALECDAEGSFHDPLSQAQPAAGLEEQAADGFGIFERLCAYENAKLLDFGPERFQEGDEQRAVVGDVGIASPP